MDTKQCVKCKKEIPVKDGVQLLRGASFACKECYKKEKEKHKDAEVCEFC